MSILFAPINKSLKIVRIQLMKDQKSSWEFGVTINWEIVVLSSSGGTVVCKIKDGRIALDSNYSRHIFVT